MPLCVTKTCGLRSVHMAYTASEKCTVEWRSKAQYIRWVMDEGICSTTEEATAHWDKALRNHSIPKRGSGDTARVGVPGVPVSEFTRSRSSVTGIDLSGEISSTAQLEAANRLMRTPLEPSAQEAGAMDQLTGGALTALAPDGVFADSGMEPVRNLGIDSVQVDGVRSMVLTAPAPVVASAPLPLCDLTPRTCRIAACPCPFCAPPFSTAAACVGEQATAEQWHLIAGWHRLSGEWAGGADEHAILRCNGL